MGPIQKMIQENAGAIFFCVLVAIATFGLTSWRSAEGVIEWRDVAMEQKARADSLAKNAELRSQAELGARVWMSQILRQSKLNFDDQFIAQANLRGFDLRPDSLRLREQPSP